MYQVTLRDLTDSPKSMPRLDVTLEVEPDLNGCGRVEGFLRVRVLEGRSWFGDAPYELWNENVSQRVDAAQWIAANYREELIEAVEQQIRERKANAEEEKQLALTA